MASLLVACWLAGCAPVAVPPIGDQGKPFRPAPDEQSLWSEAEKEEEQLAKTGKVSDDPRLEEYLSGVAARLIPAPARAAGAPPIRVVVLRDPTLSAFSMPNGTVYIHTGLLARAENEAQLAAILGHEVAHVTRRHALEWSRETRNGQILPAASHRVLGRELELAFVAAVNGFGRAREREADAEGMARMVEAGYDPREAPRLYALLRDDRGDSARLETFFFGSRRRLQERLASTRELLDTRYASLDASRLVRDTKQFPERMRVVVRDNALLDVRAGRFNLARAQLDRVLALAPGDPVTHLDYGDLYRLQSQHVRRLEDAPPLLAKARQEYERAAALDPAYPDPFRQLGFLYYQAGDTGKAREAFQRYLALGPEAPDARRIREYLVELSR